MSQGCKLKSDNINRSLFKKKTFEGKNVEETPMYVPSYAIYDFCLISKYLRSSDPCKTPCKICNHM